MPSEKPLKIVGHVIVARYDDDGEIIGERAGQIVVYAPDFDKVPQLVDDAMQQPAPPPVPST